MRSKGKSSIDKKLSNPGGEDVSPWRYAQVYRFRTAMFGYEMNVMKCNRVIGEKWKKWRYQSSSTF